MRCGRAASHLLQHHEASDDNTHDHRDDNSDGYEDGFEH